MRTMQARTLRSGPLRRHTRVAGRVPCVSVDELPAFSAWIESASPAPARCARSKDWTALRDASPLAPTLPYVIAALHRSGQVDEASARQVSFARWCEQASLVEIYVTMPRVVNFQSADFRSDDTKNSESRLRQWAHSRRAMIEVGNRQNAPIAFAVNGAVESWRGDCPGSLQGPPRTLRVVRVVRLTPNSASMSDGAPELLFRSPPAGRVPSGSSPDRPWPEPRRARAWHGPIPRS